MKTNAITRNNFSGDYWNFTTKNRGSEIVLEYNFVKNIDFILGANSGERAKIYSQYPLNLNGRVRNVFDSNNVEVLKNYYWQIVSVNPVFNVFGQVVFYECGTVKQSLDNF